MNGDQLALIRSELQLTQEEVSILLAVDERTVRRWEADETRIPGPVVAFFRVSIELVKLRGLKRFHRLVLGAEKKARR